MPNAAARHAMEMNAIMSFGVIVQVVPKLFLELIEKQENPLILESFGGIWFRKHYRYLISYKGLTFFTKCYDPLSLPSNAEIMKIKYIKIPYEEFTIHKLR